MSSEITQGIAICTYNRAHQIGEVVQATLDTKPADARVVVCDDGSNDNTADTIAKWFPDITYIRGKNMGVGANKNRAIYALRDYDFLCILEDDLVPFEPGWFEMYQEFCLYTAVHHFCRVQDKFVEETVPDFGNWVKDKLQMTPIYGPSPRGDLTFISNMVVRKVGAMHPGFQGVGHAHGQWSDRVAASGMINHPNKWIDIAEAAAKFRQLGDTSGGRWDFDKEEVKLQIKKNSALRKFLGTEQLYIQPFLP